MLEIYTKAYKNIGEMGAGCFLTVLMCIGITLFGLAISCGIIAFIGWLIMLAWNFFAPLFGITFVFTFWHGVAVYIVWRVIKGIFASARPTKD